MQNPIHNIRRFSAWTKPFDIVEKKPKKAYPLIRYAKWQPALRNHFLFPHTALLYYRIEVRCFVLPSVPHQLCYYACQKLGQKKENFERIRNGEEEENNLKN
ncbi:hypothetical protein V6Z12_A12G314900 [Gossypium hirsutum]